MSALSAALFAEMPPGLGNRLRYVLRLFRGDFEPAAAQHEEVGFALARLEDAVDEAFPTFKGSTRRQGRPAKLVSAKLKRSQQKLRWARAARRRAEAKARRLQLGKRAAEKNRLTLACLARVALSWPSTFARSFASAWRDLVGVGVAGCSRPTISRVRDAFAEICKSIAEKQAVLCLEQGDTDEILRERIFALVCARVFDIHLLAVSSLEIQACGLGPSLFVSPT